MRPAVIKHKEPTRCALFARYSSKMQDDLSLDAQIHEMEAFALKQGWEIVDRYQLPEIRSSDIERSEEWEKMLSDAKAKRWSILLVHKLDRFGRDRELVVMTKAVLRRQGVDIKSVVENLNDSIEHRMLEGIFEVFSDFYSKNLGAETRKGHKQLIRQGFWTGGTVPFGCAIEVVEGHKKPHKRLVPHPVHADVIRTIYSMVASGTATAAVLDWVETQTGDRWNPASFYTRLRNPLYHGRIEYEKTNMPAGRRRRTVPPEGRTVGEWEGLVSQELWQKANDILEERGKTMKMNRRRTPKEPYLLSQLVRCSKCLAPIVGSRAGGDYRYYYCSRKRLGCMACGLRTDEVEPAVIDAVRKAIDNLDEVALHRAYKDQLEPIKTDSVKMEAQLRRDLAECRGRQRKLVEALETGAVTADLIGGRLRELRAQEDGLADQIATCQLEADARAGMSEAGFAQFMVELRAGLEDLSQANEADLAIALRHMFRVELDLETGEGQLLVELPLSGAVLGISCGRSARTTAHPKFSLGSFWVRRAPLRHATAKRSHLTKF